MYQFNRTCTKHNHIRFYGRFICINDIGLNQSGRFSIDVQHDDRAYDGLMLRISFGHRPRLERVFLVLGISYLASRLVYKHPRYQQDQQCIPGIARRNTKITQYREPFEQEQVADVEDWKCTHQNGWTLEHLAKSTKYRKVVGHMYHSEN